MVPQPSASTRRPANDAARYRNGKQTGPTPGLNSIGLRNFKIAISLISFSDEYDGCWMAEAISYFLAYGVSDAND